MGFVFPVYNLVLTAKENVELASEIVRISGRSNCGWYGERVTFQLSYQEVSGSEVISLGLRQNPKFLLYDEPTELWTQLPAKRVQILQDMSRNQGRR